MKKKIPRYPNQESVLDEIEDTFKEKDKEIIKNFLIFCGGTAGKTTLKKYRRVMIKICDVFEGDLDQIDLDRLRLLLNTLNKSDLMAPTRNEMRKVLKRFLKEQYPDWNLRFKELRDIKGEKEINQNKINANSILTKNDIERLMRGTDVLKYKAMIMLFYETAGRPEEILNLKWQSLDLEKGDVKLKSSKTGNVRINPIKESVFHLKRYKQEYPYPNVCADDWVFPSPYERGKHQSLVAGGGYIKRLGLRVLERPIFPYLIRHTRATELQKVLPAKIYEKFMDHSIETATRYSHLDKEDVRDAMFSNVYSVEEISEDERKEYQKKLDQLTDELNNRLTREQVMEIISQSMKQAGEQTIKATMEEHKRKTKNSKSAIEILNA